MDNSLFFYLRCSLFYELHINNPYEENSFNDDPVRWSFPLAETITQKVSNSKQMFLRLYLSKTQHGFSPSALIIAQLLFFEKKSYQFKQYILWKLKF